MVIPPNRADIMDNKARAKFILVTEDGGSNSSQEPAFTQDTPFYKQIIDSSNPNIIYYGYASPGIALDVANWLITRQTISGSIVITEFAEGSREFNQKWSERAILAYS